MGLQYSDGTKVPMCAACQKNLADAHRIKQETSMRYVNFLRDDIEATIGVRGVLARFELPAESPVTNHIHIESSNIGVVNSGVIHHIDSAIGQLQSSGDGQLAVAFKQVTQAIVDAPDVDKEKKAEILEQLSLLSEEAAKPKGQRRLVLMKGILENVKLAADAIRSVAPIVMNAWPHIVAALSA
jgi:hypothetical protein